MQLNRYSTQALKPGFNHEAVYIESFLDSWHYDVVCSQVLRAIESKTPLEIYLNCEGGDTIIAKKICSKLKELPGDQVICRGSVIIGSAATYISSVIKIRGGVVSMPENGVFFIHKPETPSGGNEDELKVKLKRVTDVTNEYRNIYAEVTGKSPEAIENLFKNAAFLTAQEALDWGFITEISDPIELFEEELKIVAQLQSIDTIIKNSNMSKIKVMASLLGTDETEEAVFKAVTVLNEKANRLETANTDLTKKVETLEAKLSAETKGKITAMIDAAKAANKISEKEAASYTKLAETNFDDVKAILDEKTPYKSITDALNNSGGKSGSEVYAGWDYMRLMKEAPKELERIKAEEPERFEKLRKGVTVG